MQPTTSDVTAAPFVVAGVAAEGGATEHSERGDDRDKGDGSEDL